MGFEEQLQQSIFSTDKEKTFIDKLLGREDSERIREIIKRPDLTREDLLDLLYLIVGTESKLSNLGEWDRYIILKYFVWVQEFVKICELLYDYIDDLYINEITCYECRNLFKSYKKKPALCKCKNPVGIMALTKRTRKILYNIERLMDHNAKFLISLYFNIVRTTLSIGATGFMELLKNKFEVVYPSQQLTESGKESRTPFISWGGKK